MIEIKLPVDAALVPALEDYFCEQIRCPWGVFREGTAGAYRLFGYFEDADAAGNAWRELRGAFPALPESPDSAQLDDRDWKEAYKEHLKPWSSRGLHWVPVWMRETYSAPEGEAKLFFDAGLAFGTGDHPTTRLCAGRLLDYRDAHKQTGFENARVIDAGCGSGILAISAALLGFRQVYGFDRDPEAVRVSRENAAFNGLDAARVSFSDGGIEAGLAGRTAEVLLCNIQADVLCLYADVLLGAVSPGGVLALSGILAEEQAAVRAHFEPLARQRFGANVRIDGRVMGDWSDLAIFA